MPLLKVVKAKRGEVLMDIVRVPKGKRNDLNGRTIEAGTVCKITLHSTGKSAFIILRGLDCHESGDVILMDEYVREILGVDLGREYNFNFETRWWYRFVWPWKATNIGYKISSEIALVSLILGALSIVLGLLPFFSRL